MMNERIRELAEQALKSSMVHDGMYRPEGYANGVSKDFADKFAELIVRESMVVTKDYTCNQGLDYSAPVALARHFGVMG